MTGCPRKATSLHRRTATRRHSRRLCEAAGTVPTPFLDSLSRKSVTGPIKLKCAIAHALERLPMAALGKLRRQRNSSCALVLHLHPCPVMKAAPGTQNGSIEFKKCANLNPRSGSPADFGPYLPTFGLPRRSRHPTERAGPWAGAAGRAAGTNRSSRGEATQYWPFQLLVNRRPRARFPSRLEAENSRC
jgi:hypothetical protein